MHQPAALNRVLRFGAFELDVSAGELRKDGVRIRLQGQPFQVLCILLERAGGIVARDELRQRLWPEGTFVDFEHSLNTAIKKLREGLGDDADNPRFVETIARRGYRFIANVAIPAATPSAPPRAWPRLYGARNAVLAGSAACALVLLFLYYSHSLSSKASQPTIIPVVTNVGEKFTPSLSPDGQRLAFAWNGGTGSEFSLYVKLVGTEEPLRLTKQPSIDFNPVWSPDGRYLAFCRIMGGETGIYVIPALGGAERRVRKTLWEEREFYEVFWNADRLSWSPDGKSLAFSDRASRDEPASSIFLLSLDSQEVRRLTAPMRSSGDFHSDFSPSGQTLAFVSLRSRGDFNPEFSPDGQTLAFARISQGVQSIYTVAVAGGEEKRLKSGVTYNWGLAWAPNGRDLVFANAGWLAEDGWLWKISLRGNEPQRLQFGQGGVEPSIRGNRLVYVRQMANLNIWTRKLRSLLSASPPDRLISSTRMESGPQFSPDGSRIVFESTRSGANEIWMCRSGGSGLIQLTHFNSHSGTPRWSPDGQQIAFDSRVAGQADIYVMDSQGGPPRRLTSEPSSEVVPSWSRDGRWIYFASNRTAGWELWKMPSTGGPAVQVTHNGGFAAFESPDGKFLFYAKGLNVPGLWRIPVSGGEETEVIRSLEAGYWGYWAVVESGIFYLDTTTKPAIAFFDLTTHRATRVFDLENRPGREAAGLAVSPDKMTILYTQLDALNSDIVLVENFR
ncbi:MAG TPA: winged helix-turn-helix domain-containing protein [Terriglobales bacterium]|nr:winged helix-turn-helix domain-containing protein [Terriglobales bacterium]